MIRDISATWDTECPANEIRARLLRTVHALHGKRRASGGNDVLVVAKAPRLSPSRRSANQATGSIVPVCGPSSRCVIGAQCFDIRVRMFNRDRC